MTEPLKVGALDSDTIVYRVVRTTGERRVHTANCASLDKATSRVEDYTVEEYIERFDDETLVCKNCAGRDYDLGTQSWDSYRALIDADTDGHGSAEHRKLK